MHTQQSTKPLNCNTTMVITYKVNITCRKQSGSFQTFSPAEKNSLKESIDLGDLGSRFCFLRQLTPEEIEETVRSPEAKPAPRNALPDNFVYDSTSYKLDCIYTESIAGLYKCTNVKWRPLLSEKRILNSGLPKNIIEAGLSGENPWIPFSHYVAGEDNKFLIRSKGSRALFMERGVIDISIPVDPHTCHVREITEPDFRPTYEVKDTRYFLPDCKIRMMKEELKSIPQSHWLTLTGCGSTRKYLRALYDIMKPSHRLYGTKCLIMEVLAPVVF